MGLVEHERPGGEQSPSGTRTRISKRCPATSSLVVIERLADESKRDIRIHINLTSLQEVASFIEDRRVLAALWTLVMQRGIAETTMAYSDRAAVRRTLRAGLAKSDSEIRIVKLRKLDRTYSGEGPPGGHYSHRWVVSGHWRRQPCGPGRKDRRLTFIPPHVKGPEDKPLVVKEQVNAWVR